MLKIERAGIQTTIQDLGRFGFRSQGVPLSGVMDSYAAKNANLIVGNLESYPVIEFAFMGPKLKVLAPCKVCVSGAHFLITVNDTAVSINKPILLDKGDVLDITSSKKGSRGYLAIAGGFKAEVVLGSTSFYKGITKAYVLKKGNILKAAKHPVSDSTIITIDEAYLDTTHCEVLKGPEFDAIPNDMQQSLFKSKFTVSPDSNRMATLLTHHSKIKAPQIISSPVQPGTVQLTPSGSLIVLMRDAQTTGGYARILQLTENEINKLSQKRLNSTLNFFLKK